MDPLPCYICHNSTELYQKNLYKTKSKYSETPIWDFLIKLTKGNVEFEEYIVEAATESLETCVVCTKCLQLIDEYDLACVTTQRIEKQLLGLLVDKKLRPSDDPLIPHFAEVNESHDDFMLDAEDVPNNQSPHNITKFESDDEDDKNYDYDIALGQLNSLGMLKPNVEFKYKCSKCSSTFKFPTHLAKHYQAHRRAEKELICKICCIRLRNNTDFAKHKKLHDEHVATQCVICTETKVYKTRKLLLKHMRAKHKSESASKFEFVCEPSSSEAEASKNNETFGRTQDEDASSDRKSKFKCTICGFELRDLKSLTEHEELHKSYGPTQCVICEKKFSTKSNRYGHMRSHLPDDLKPFQCERCGRKFAHKIILDVHMQSHDDVRRFECDVCKRRFKNEHKVKQHIQYVHTGIKPFACSYCGKAFSRRDNLRYHEQVHAGVVHKKYQCKFCERAYARKPLLSKHIQNAHGVAEQIDNTNTKL